MLSDHSADVAMAARLRAEYGLDRPLLEQFLRYVGGIAIGDFGLSFRYVHMPVSSVLKDSLAISPMLALAALALALAARRVRGYSGRDPPQPASRDTAIILVLVAGLSIPNFAIATFLVYLVEREAQSASRRRLGHVAPGDPAGGDPGHPERRLYRAA